MITIVLRTASFPKNVHLKRKINSRFFKSQGIAQNRQKSRSMSSRREKKCFFKKRMDVAEIESGWSKKSPHLRVLTHFGKPSAKSQRKSPIISVEERFCPKTCRKMCSIIFPLLIERQPQIKSYIINIFQKKSLLNGLYLKTSYYIQSYCISSNRVFPLGYSHKRSRSSQILAILLKFYCSLSSLGATCLDG